MTSELNPMMDEDVMRNLMVNGFDSPDIAQRYLDESTSVYELIPHLEATAIEFIIRLPESGDLNEKKKEELLERLLLLSDIYRDVRIKTLLLNSWLVYGPNKIEKFDDKLKVLYEQIKNNLKQVDMVNAETEKVNFIKILIDNYLIYDKDILFYFEDILNHLFAKKPSPSVGFGLIGLAGLAYNVCENYYSKLDLNNGDIFHIRIDKIAGMFSPNIPTQIINFKKKAVAKRVETVKGMVKQ